MTAWGSALANWPPMNEKLIPTLLSIAFVVFLLYLLVVSPLGKLNALCSPVTAAGAVASATVRMAGGPESARATQTKFEGYFNGCRIWFWNIFYEDKYREMKGVQRPTQPARPASSPRPAPAVQPAQR